MQKAAEESRLLRDIPWERSSPQSVSPTIIRLLAAASLVESRGDDYGEYLVRVFSDDADFVHAIRNWSNEENEHGIALGTWLTRSVPGFSFDNLLKRYNAAIKLSYQESSSNVSIRGSKSAELLSRCAVESSTSTYYKAVAAAVSDEPLKIICTRLSKDEVTHYALFRRKLDDVKIVEKIGSLKLVYYSILRLLELEDDQMSYAYYIAANVAAPYDRSYCSKILMRTAFKLYTRERIAELIKINLRAFGVSKSWAIRFIGYERLVAVLASTLRIYMKLRVIFLELKETFHVLNDLILRGRYLSRGY